MNLATDAVFSLNMGSREQFQVMTLESVTLADPQIGQTTNKIRRLTLYHRTFGGITCVP